jgi:hypothetical protein
MAKHPQGKLGRKGKGGEYGEKRRICMLTTLQNHDQTKGFGTPSNLVHLMLWERIFFTH